IRTRIVLSSCCRRHHYFVKGAVVGVESCSCPELELPVVWNCYGRRRKVILRGVKLADVFPVHVRGTGAVVNQGRGRRCCDAVVKGPALAGSYAVVKNSPSPGTQFPGVVAQIRHSSSLEAFHKNL